MKKAAMSIVTAFAFLLSCITPPGLAQTENAVILHQYSGIPFDSVTPDGVPRILREKGNNRLADEYGEYPITDFGYPLYMDVNYNENYVGAYRIVLSKEGDVWGLNPEFEGMVRRDVLQFVDMEAQLSRQYGEPDCRFFYTDVSKYDVSYLTRFMFPSGTWDATKMMGVCKSDRYLMASSVWGNVELRLWVDWVNKKKSGYLTKLNLFYYDEAVFQTPKTIVEYPPEHKLTD